MELVDENITLGLSIFLDNIVTSLLYKEEEKDGKVNIVQRVLPFRLQYRLTRNKTALDRDLEIYNEKKMLLFAKYGEPVTDDNGNTTVKITSEENNKKYQEELVKLFESPATHNVIKLDMEDINLITDSIPMSEEAMKLFIGYMTDDPKLLNDLSKDISKEMTDLLAQKEEKKEEVIEKNKENVEVKSATVKKTPQKKTTTKTTSTKKTTSTSRKTTAKKTTKKVDTKEK